jgi:hypothetical protein
LTNVWSARKEREKESWANCYSVWSGPGVWHISRIIIIFTAFISTFHALSLLMVAACYCCYRQCGPLVATNFVWGMKDIHAGRGFNFKHLYSDTKCVSVVISSFFGHHDSVQIQKMAPKE